MTADSSFRDHIERISAQFETSLEIARQAPGGRAFEGVVLHAGSPRCYHADDIEIPFRAHAHFLRWAPVTGGQHLLLFEPGRRPRLHRVAPRDYWEAPPIDPGPDVAEVLEIRDFESQEAAVLGFGRLADHAFVGADRETAERLGIASDAVEPASLMAPLDFHRGLKTGYEVECIRAAAALAARGHAAVRDAVAAGESERALHLRYLAATGAMERELPYPNIIAWDAHAATLHHQYLSADAPQPGNVLLIDAGATHRHYASDVTRTLIGPGGGPDPSFAALLDGLETLQRRLVEAVAPGRCFVDLHRQAESGIASLLVDAGVLRVGSDEAVERGLVRPFFPHGLGHHLGLQVHDVAGQMADAHGTPAPPPPDLPNLRTTRRLEPGNVVTIEPGLYFIPSLLEPVREGTNREHYDFALIDALAPGGGIRIEDDVCVTESGVEDLSRPLIPGHCDPARVAG